MKRSVFTVADHYPEKKRSIAQLYLEITEQAVVADHLGYDSFFVAEHHFHEYGVIPNPAVFLSSLAALTKQIKLGPAISILPFRNPLQVAEDYLMLQQLSSGRALLGVGSGYLKHEFEGFGIDPEEKRARFDEHLAILNEALSGKRFSFKGKNTEVNNVELNVSSAQPVPLYVAVLRKEAAYHVGKKGYNIICVPYASVEGFDDVYELIRDYRRGFAESGKQGKGETLFAFHTHAAETEEQARENAEANFNLYLDTRLYARKQNYNDILKSGLSLFGSVDTVNRKLLQLEEMGVDNVLMLMNFGMLENHKVKNSLKFLANKNVSLQ